MPLEFVSVVKACRAAHAIGLSSLQWSTGQDAVATIKRQLQLLVPDVSVFLVMPRFHTTGFSAEMFSLTSIRILAAGC